MNPQSYYIGCKTHAMQSLLVGLKSCKLISRIVTNSNDIVQHKRFGFKNNYCSDHFINKIKFTLNAFEMRFLTIATKCTTKPECN